MKRKEIANYSSYLLVRGGIRLAQVFPKSFVRKLIVRILNISSYRKNTILLNLQASFPENTSAANNLILRDFYKNLATVFVSQSHGANGDHITYKDISIVNELMKKYGTVLLIGSHFSCWEATGKGITKHLDTEHQYVAYKKVKNKHVDNYLKDMRSDTVATPIEMKKLYRQVIVNKRKGLYSAFYLIADQYPSSLQNTVELPFLNQTTRFINGPEKIATSLELPVVFLKLSINSEEEMTVIPEIIFEPNQEDTKGITEKIKETLEVQILENPSYWLWSHKRWKNLR